MGIGVRLPEIECLATTVNIRGREFEPAKTMKADAHSFSIMTKTVCFPQSSALVVYSLICSMYSNFGQCYLQMWSLAGEAGLVRLRLHMCFHG